MESTNPHRFDQMLRSVLHEQRENILALWNGPDTPFTSLFMDVVLPEVGRRLGLIPHPYEYYFLDRIYVAEYDTEHFGPESGYPKSFSVILEHEIKFKKSCEEMSKLLLFNSPLKVLITYARSGHGLEDILACYVRMIEGGGKRSISASSQRILVVFGDKPGEIPTWRTFLYEEHGFVEISPTETS